MFPPADYRCAVAWELAAKVGTANELRDLASKLSMDWSRFEAEFKGTVAKDGWHGQNYLFDPPGRVLELWMALKDPAQELVDMAAKGPNSASGTC